MSKKRAELSGEQNGSQQINSLGVSAEQLARGLGWFSIGLGLAEVLAPSAINKISGGRGRNTGFIRLFGLREIASGIAIFAQGKRPAAAVWSRVAGDALDLAALGLAFASPDTNKGRVAFATANVMTVAALDVICARQLSSSNDESVSARAAAGGTQVRKSIIINRTPEELYQFWHDFENLPRFMTDLESVQVTDERRSHWVAKAPAGTSVEWDAEITADEPNRLISWRSLEGADVDNSGTVRFERATGGRGTIVTVEIEYNPPGGSLGAVVAKLFGKEPGQQAQEALRCFKQLMETGEVIVSEGTVWDNGLLTQRPAQPLSSEELPKTLAAGAKQV
ncbi:MAG TPA: SRPBCC family protein [Pyrinomonadaceae bacterium]|jgi:uncharacterized membrane protein